MPRQEDLSDFEDDDEPVIEKTKEKKKKEKKTLVFEIELAEDVNEKYEYNYKEMVKEHEERMKKVDSDIEIIEILDDDPVPKKKKYKKPVNVDPEDEYDLDDDFIDDTEADDEVVPDQVSTARRVLHQHRPVEVRRVGCWSNCYRRQERTARMIKVPQFPPIPDGSKSIGGSYTGSGAVPGRSSTPSIVSAKRTPTQGSI